MEQEKTTIKVNDISKLDTLVNKYKDKDINIELSEENKKINPWAICNSRVGNKDKDKFEACVQAIKNKKNIEEEIVDDSDKLIELITSRLSSQLSKINTPNEKAKLIIHFANLLDIPSNKIGEVVSSIKKNVRTNQIAENNTLKVKKNELFEIIKNKINSYDK